MSDLVTAAVWIMMCYLLGMAPFGDMISRTAGVDIRVRGTGNPGAANVYRELGARYGVAVFSLDFAKGVVATAPLMMIESFPWLPFAAAFAVVLGHILPALGKRSGGTGMTTAMGTTAGLAPFGLVAGVPAALVVLAVTRNAGYTGAALFLVTSFMVGLVWEDVAGALGVLGVGAVVLVKARIQYAGRPTE